MDEDTIRKIAAGIVRHLPSYSWTLLIIQVILTLSAAGLGAFFGEYLKTRGKNLATKADFETLQAQLSTNTELVETIKAEVGQRDWAQREWTNLRRLKLEELLERVNDCEAYLRRFEHSCVDGKVHDERDPHPQVVTIYNLYFPELESGVIAFSLAYGERKSAGYSLAKEVMTTSDLAAREKVYDKMEAATDFSKLSNAISALRDAARKLLTEIMGVAVQP